MFNFLKKKKNQETSENPETSEENPEDQTENSEQLAQEEKEKKSAKKPEKTITSDSADLIRLSTEIDRLKASQEAFQEVRKSSTERFTRMSEQIGELRAMIMDRDRTIQEIELKAIKASDLVQSVEPEKLMTEVQKQEVKIEAIKANLEGNESIMSRIMDELKEIRRKVEFFRGIEEIIKLSEEVKKELIEIKKLQGVISTDADKVETMYSEIRKKIQFLDNFDIQLQDIKANSEQNTKDVDYLKIRISDLASKDELEKLVNKVQKYTDSLKEINKSSSLSKDIDQLKILIDGLK